MDAPGRKQLISELCSIEGRWPGTDAERRAAQHLAGRLRSVGRRADVEPTYVHPEWSLAAALHLALAIAGGMLALVSGVAGFVVVLLAATSLYLDQSTRFYLLRRLLFRRASQNVVSPGRRPDAPARVVLCAHLDAGRTGWVFGPEARGVLRLTPKSLRVVLGPLRLGFWAGIVPLLAIAGLRMAEVDARWLDFAQLVPTVLLLVLFVLMIDIALSGVVPGALKNGSGVASVLSVAAALDADPPANLDVWVLLPGAGECNSQGMAAYLRAHRKEIDGEHTYFVNLDSVAGGKLAYLTGEGTIATYRADRRLVELAAAVAAARDAGSPLQTSLHTDAVAIAARGMRAISVVGAADGLPPPHHHRASDIPSNLDEAAMTEAVEFTLDLVRAIDADVGRDDHRI